MCLSWWIFIIFTPIATILGCIIGFMYGLRFIANKKQSQHQYTPLSSIQIQNDKPPSPNVQKGVNPMMKKKKKKKHHYQQPQQLPPQYTQQPIPQYVNTKSSRPKKRREQTIQYEPEPIQYYDDYEDQGEQQYQQQNEYYEEQEEFYDNSGYEDFS